MSYFKPDELVERAEEAAIKRDSTSTKNTLILAFLAGCYIALGGLLAIIVGGGMPQIAQANPGIAKFAMGAVFPLGLILCVIAGADLFTGNTAYFIPPIISDKLKFKNLIRNWSLVYIGNFIGSIFIAYVLTYKTGILAQAPWSDSLLAMAKAKTSASFGVVFAKGIGANWLVALAVWLAFAAKDITGKIIAIWFPVMAFVAMGFEHSVANMFFIPAAIFHGADISWGTFIFNNLIPATLGNIVGGSILTGGIYGYVYKK